MSFSSEQQAAQTDAMNKIAALVGAQLEGTMRQIQQQQTMVQSPVPMHTVNYSTASIPFPKPINVKDGDVIDNFKFFQLQWNNYLVASGTDNKSEEVKKSTLLAAIGEDCLKRYTSFTLTDDDQLTEKSLLNAIGRNLMPVLNKRYERAMFNLATQKGKESYVTYVNRLKKLIKNCEYGDLEDDILLDKLICSIKDVSLREQVWSDKDITLEQALEKCKAKEITQKQLESIKAEVNSQQSTVSNNKVVTNQKPQNNENKKQQQPKIIHQHKNVTIIQNSQAPPVTEKVSQPSSAPQSANKLPNRKCMACGNGKKGAEHAANRNECPANNVTCNMCGNKNHLTSMCRLKIQQNMSENKKK